MTRGARAALGVVIGHVLMLGGFAWMMASLSVACGSGSSGSSGAEAGAAVAAMYVGIAVLAYGFGQWAAWKGRSRWFALLAPLSWIGVVVMLCVPRRPASGD